MPLSEFPVAKRRSGTLYVRPHCWQCKYKNHDKGRDNSAYLRSYYLANKLDHKYKAYRHNDKALAADTIDRDSAVELMMRPCFYCDKDPSHGLDRINNALGHVKDNVRPCCEVCNNILGDLPVEVKNMLREGLRKSREGGYLEGWIIPTKRRGARLGTSHINAHTQGD